MDTISKDYIFKDINGQLKYIGNFDDLYRYVDDPWSQKSSKSHKPHRLSLIKHLDKLHPKSVLDVGCGFGHLTQAVKTLITDDVFGVDISNVCIRKAKALFPDTDFKTLDIRVDSIGRNFDVVILNGVLWYILEDLDIVINKISDTLNDNGYIIFVQAFIPNQRYAKDIIDGYSGFLKVIKSYKRVNLFKAICFSENGRDDCIVILKTNNGNS